MNSIVEAAIWPAPTPHTLDDLGTMSDAEAWLAAALDHYQHVVLRDALSDSLACENARELIAGIAALSDHARETLGGGNQ